MKKTEAKKLLVKVQDDLATVKKGTPAHETLLGLERCISTALAYPEVTRERVLEVWDGEHKVGEQPVSALTLDVPADFDALVKEGLGALKEGWGWHHTGFPEYKPAEKK